MSPPDLLLPLLSCRLSRPRGSMALRRPWELPGNERCRFWPRVGRRGSPWAWEWRESQAHVSDAQLAALKAAESGGPLRAAR